MYIWYQCPIEIQFSSPFSSQLKLKCDLVQICSHVFSWNINTEKIEFWSVIYKWNSSTEAPSIIFLVALTTDYKIGVLKQCKYKISHSSSGQWSVESLIREMHIRDIYSFACLLMYLRQCLPESPSLFSDVKCTFLSFSRGEGRGVVAFLILICFLTRSHHESTR